MMQCPNCGARWESPDGADEKQFVLCKECSKKIAIAPSHKAYKYTKSIQSAKGNDKEILTSGFGTPNSNEE
jgi:DNA-directed RNA polymerase subunit RPC12/RpoP